MIDLRTKWNEVYNLQKLRQVMKRQHTLSNINPSRFVTFRFPKIWNPRTHSYTDFGKHDIALANDKLKEFIKRLDRKLDSCGDKSDLPNRIKFVAIPEIETQTGNKCPLHFHAIFEIEPSLLSRFDTYAPRIWNKLFNEDIKIKNAQRPKGLHINKINSNNKVISYCFKQLIFDWNFDNHFDYVDYCTA
jgi:hypothetical protein